MNLKHVYGTDGLTETIENGEEYYVKSVPENLLVVEFDDDSKLWLKSLSKRPGNKTQNAELLSSILSGNKIQKQNLKCGY